MALTDADRLRMLLGETIPAGGDDSDTLFTDAEIEEFLTINTATGDMDRSAYEGWRVKAARLSNLVDTTEGNAQRKMSQALTNAQQMVKLYQRSSSGPTEGRARVGTIKRPELEW